jgi:hypothetical protein
MEGAKPTKTQKHTKFIIIQDVFMKKEIESLVKPPDGGTNFILWYNTPDHENPNGWGKNIYL